MAELENDSQPRLGVLISGRGSNLQAIIDAIATRRLAARIAVVVSNRADAQGLQRARDAGIDAVWSEPARLSRSPRLRSRVGRLADRSRCDAGVPRGIHAPGRTVASRRVSPPDSECSSIAAAVVPRPRGAAAGARLRRACYWSDRPCGDEELDGGPIILQAAVPVLEHDTVDTLAARVLVEEHRLYPEAIRLILEGRWSIVGRRLVGVATT